MYCGSGCPAPNTVTIIVHRVPPLAIAPASRMRNLIEARHGAKSLSEIHVHAGRDDGRRHEAHRHVQRQPLPDLAQHLAAVVGAHERRQMRSALNRPETRKHVTCVPSGIEDRQRLFSVTHCPGEVPSDNAPTLRMVTRRSSR
jgi:hypothetical protein